MNEMTPTAVDFQFVASMKAKYDAEKDLVKVCVLVFIIFLMSRFQYFRLSAGRRSK